MKYLLFVSILFFITSCGSRNKLQITDNVQDENSECYMVKSSFYTAYLEKQSGGITSLLDKNGKDWISFNKTEQATYPASAASDYRGLPNLVFQGDDNGFGHPGFNQAETVQTGENSILFKSISGLWEIEYKFFPSYFSIEILKTDTSRAYWFLYEGTPAGKFESEKIYWGNNTLGHSTELIDYYIGESKNGNWDWIYFGVENYPYTLFLEQETENLENDLLGFLGSSGELAGSTDGMVVMGFGRDKGAIPLIQDKHKFNVGFYKPKTKNVFSEISSFFNSF